MPADSPNSDSQPVLSYQGNTDLHETTYDLSSTKCLGTFRTMAPASSSPPAETRPLNPNVYRPVTPPSHPSIASSHDGSSKVFTKFPFSTVALIRVVAIAFSITLVVLECDGRRQDSGRAGLFIFLAIMQLLWLTFALLSQGNPRRGDRRKGFTIDLGFVTCIFGRQGYDEDSDVTLGWIGGSSGKKSTAIRWLYTGLDITFAVISFIAGVVAAGNPYCWYWESNVAISVIALVTA